MMRLQLVRQVNGTNLVIRVMFRLPREMFERNQPICTRKQILLFTYVFFIPIHQRNPVATLLVQHLKLLYVLLFFHAVLKFITWSRIMRFSFHATSFIQVKMFSFPYQSHKGSKEQNFPEIVASFSDLSVISPLSLNIVSS